MEIEGTFKGKYYKIYIENGFIELIDGELTDEELEELSYQF